MDSNHWTHQIQRSWCSLSYFFLLSFQNLRSYHFAVVNCEPEKAILPQSKASKRNFISEIAYCVGCDSGEKRGEGDHSVYNKA